MPDYTYGLRGALVTITALTAIEAIIIVVGNARAALGLQLKMFISAAVGLIALSVVGTLSLFPATFCTFNFFGQDIFSSTFWKAEFANGMFAVRISSYLFIYQLVMIARRFLQNKQHIRASRSARGVHENQFTPWESLKPEEGKLLKQSNLAICSVSQFVFFLCIISSLWLCAIEGVHTGITALSSWCLFFIADDWAIISDYTNEFNVPAMRMHTYKVLAFDLALFLLVSLSLLLEVHNTIRFLLIISLLICSVGICMFTWRARLLHAAVEDVS